MTCFQNVGNLRSFWHACILPVQRKLYLPIDFVVWTPKYHWQMEGRRNQMQIPYYSISNRSEEKSFVWTLFGLMFIWVKCMSNTE